MVTGYAIFAHGSAVESANEAVRAVSREFARRTGHGLVEPCFLELGQPDLAGAASALVGRGATRIVVVPYFLTSGKHLTEDLPRIAASIQRIYPSVEVLVAAPLDGHPALVGILAERAGEASA